MEPANLALTGQATCIAALRRTIQSEGFGHAILLASADTVAVDAVATWCAAQIVCVSQSPEPCGTCVGCKSFMRRDGRTLFHAALDERPTYGVEDMRAVRNFLALRAGQVGRRVVRIDDVDRCTAPAANALLKVLEEPGAAITFVLTTAAPDRVLPTIRSRAMLYRLQPVAREQMVQQLTAFGVPPKKAEAVIAAAPGQLGSAAAIANTEELYAAVQATDTLADTIAHQPTAAKLRTLATYFAEKRELNEQRQHAQVLLAAFARRSADDSWVRQRLDRLLAACKDLQSNGQPKLILEAFVA